jgi:hypothetical protein
MKRLTPVKDKSNKVIKRLMLLRIEAMNRLTLPSFTLLPHRSIAIPMIPNLSEIEYI